MVECRWTEVSRGESGGGKKFVSGSSLQVELALLASWEAKGPPSAADWHATTSAYPQIHCGPKGTGLRAVATRDLQPMSEGWVGPAFLSSSAAKLGPLRARVRLIASEGMPRSPQQHCSGPAVGSVAGGHRYSMRCRGEILMDSQLLSRYREQSREPLHATTNTIVCSSTCAYTEISLRLWSYLFIFLATARGSCTRTTFTRQQAKYPQRLLEHTVDQPSSYTRPSNIPTDTHKHGSSRRPADSSAYR